MWVKVMFAALLLMVGCATPGGLEGRWVATSSELADGQPQDCLSAPRVESCVVGEDSARVTFVFPDGQHDVRQVTWKTTDEGAQMGRTVTWSEWDLAAVVFVETDRGLEGTATWEGWVDCRQRVVMERE